MGNTINKTAYGYIRVSGEEQLKGFGLQFQEQDIRAFAEKNDITLVKIVRDEGVSGATADRPGLQELMQAAREKKFDILIVWKLDRLFRDTKLTLQTLDELTSYGIEFRSVHEVFTHDSSGRFLLTLMASVAEMERKNIAHRMIAGRLLSVRKGTWICGGTPPYGYNYNETSKRLEIDEREARVVRLIYTWLVKDKLTTYAIQNKINGMGIPTKWANAKKRKRVNSDCWWQRGAILRILKNEIYTGKTYIRKWKKAGHAHTDANLRPQEDWIEYASPPIISKELFDQAQAQIESNKLLAPRRTTRTYLFAKKLLCGACGRRYFAAF